MLLPVFLWVALMSAGATSTPLMTSTAPISAASANLKKQKSYLLAQNVALQQSCDPLLDPACPLELSSGLSSSGCLEAWAMCYNNELSFRDPICATSLSQSGCCDEWGAMVGCAEALSGPQECSSYEDQVGDLKSAQLSFSCDVEPSISPTASSPTSQGTRCLEQMNACVESDQVVDGRCADDLQDNICCTSWRVIVHCGASQSWVGDCSGFKINTSKYQSTIQAKCTQGQTLVGPVSTPDSISIPPSPTLEPQYPPSTDPETELESKSPNLSASEESCLTQIGACISLTVGFTRPCLSNLDQEACCDSWVLVLSCVDKNSGVDACKGVTINSQPYETALDTRCTGQKRAACERKLVDCVESDFGSVDESCLNYEQKKSCCPLWEQAIRCATDTNAARVCRSVRKDTTAFQEAFDSQCSDTEASSACFPSAALVTFASGLSLEMSRLSIGDRVLARDSQMSDVYFFSHRLDTGDFDFLEFVTNSSDFALVVSPGHLLYTAEGVKPARLVAVGDMLFLADMTNTKVTSIRSIRQTGLFNPHTLQGDIVVNGYLVTTWTETVSPHFASLLLLPFRLLYRFFGVHVEGLLDGELHTPGISLQFSSKALSRRIGN